MCNVLTINGDRHIIRALDEERTNKFPPVIVEAINIEVESRWTSLSSSGSQHERLSSSPLNVLHVVGDEAALFLSLLYHGPLRVCPGSDWLDVHWASSVDVEPAPAR